MSSSSNDHSNCVICFEYLCSATMGTVIDCGHVFHESCYKSWEKSSKRYRHGEVVVKCPICNTHATSFRKLFLDLPQQKEQDDTSDDESSVEEDDGRSISSSNTEDIHEVPIPSTGTSPHEAIEIVDIEDSPRGVTATAPSQAARENKEYKQKARKYKKRMKQMESQLREKMERHQQWMSEKSKLTEELQETKDKLEVSEEKVQKGCLEINEVKVELATVKRLRNVLNTELEKAQSDSIKFQSEMERMQSYHRVELERASARSMSEVETILKEKPKLDQKIQKYSESVLEKDNIIAELKADNTRLKKLVSAKADKQIESRAQPFSKKKLTKSWSEVGKAAQPGTAAAAARPPKEPNEYNGKKSAHSARMSRAINKVKSRKANDALDSASAPRRPPALHISKKPRTSAGKENSRLAPRQAPHLEVPNLGRKSILQRKSGIPNYFGGRSMG